ncbi:MAG: DDE-type integrase/transposase/recombinase [Candidatus Bathyarchaeia archaeon]|jgi:transposase-like protein
MATLNQREQKGLDIAKMPNQINRIDAETYVVKSQSNNGEYKVFKVSGEWYCECADHVYRHEKCKHIFAVEFSSQIRKEVQTSRVIQEVNVQDCQYCGSSNLKKDGIRRNKTGAIQKFHCRDCHHYFTINIGFERMKHNPQAITSAMQLYFSGESLRNTQKSLKLLGVEVTHKTVFMWIKKYVKLMKDYVENFKPNVSDTWRADELYVKVKGNMKYVFALLDDETRFWIAQEVAETKYKHDARKLFELGEQLMGKKPATLITDGLLIYHDAYKKAFWTRKGPRTQHVRHIAFRGDRNNNKMERFNGEIRDREKTMRGLKTKETPILSGYQIFHNYIRPHEALEGRTPAEACGITVEGKNKWLTLIQNASKK